jgi:hypothetical protein
MSRRRFIRIVIVSAIFSLSLNAVLAADSSKNANATIKRIEGVYKTRFANSTVHDEHFTSENILEIVPYDGDKIYFRIHLEFYNAHLCDLVGIAIYEGGKFVFRIPNDVPADSCQLAISQAGGDIVLEDVGGNCKTYSCGARGGFQGSGFPMKARREIKYMKLLKSSREYLDAIAEFEKATQPPPASH